MPNKCTFSDRCDRPVLDGPAAAIGRAPGAGCPFPNPVIDRAWSRGEHLFHQGEPVKGAFSLRAGLVALERVDEHGDLVVIKLLKPGAFFPCSDLFSDGHHANSARALTDAVACFVPADRLGSLLSSNPRMGLEIAKRGCGEARDNEDLIFRMASGDLGERVLALLESLADEAGAATFTLPLQWRDLASMVGTSPEVMSRLMRKMAEAGRVAVSGRTVTLLPHRNLERRAQG